jgi:hypothetical protein
MRDMTKSIMKRKPMVFLPVVSIYRIDLKRDHRRNTQAKSRAPFFPFRNPYGMIARESNTRMRSIHIKNEDVEKERNVEKEPVPVIKEFARE